MKPQFLLIIFASTVLAISQNRSQPQYPIDVLCPTTIGENLPQGYVLNSKVASIELPPYPQDAHGKRVAAHVFVQVVINQNGEVITAMPVQSGPEGLWADSVKAAVSARFDPKNLSSSSSKTDKIAGILVFAFFDGKVELQKMPDPNSPPSIPPVRRGIPKPE